MVGLIQNLNMVELVVIAVVAVLVFGKRLPEVAGQAAHGLAKARRALTDLRRQTGIDEELRQVRRNFEDAEREARRAVDPALAEARRGITPTRPPESMARGQGSEGQPKAAEEAAAVPARAEPETVSPSGRAEPDREQASPGGLPATAHPERGSTQRPTPPEQAI